MPAEPVHAGGNASFEFVVINQGTVATSGRWQDTVYLSVDNKVGGDDIRVKDLPLPAEVTVLSEPEVLVVTVRVVAAEVSAEEAEPEAVAAAEPEVISRPDEEQPEEQEG